MTMEAPPRIRPGWVWGIFLLYLISTVWTAVVHILRAIGRYPTIPAMEQYFASLTLVDWGLTWALLLLQLTAATLLWLLRRQALWWFMVAFFLGAANFGRHLATRDLGAAFAGLGVIGVIVLVFSMGIGLILSAAILAYVWGLYKRGVLA